MHRAEACRFSLEKCRKCGKIGHIAKKCCTREYANQVTNPDTDDSDSENQVTDLEAEIDTDLNGVVTAKSTKAGYLVTVAIGGNNVAMQLDTGAAVSIIPETTYKSHLSKFTLTETKPLKSYSGDKLELLGQIRVPVKYESQTATLPLVVAKGNKVP